jgi:hypothetical protein
LDRSQLANLVAWVNWLSGQGRQDFPVDEQYENLLTRIVGFLLVSDCQPPSSELPLAKRLQRSRALNAAAIVGPSAAQQGATAERVQPDDVAAVTEIVDARKVAYRPSYLGSLRTVVLWNRDQLSVLQSNHTSKSVVFDADFGCGKTLLLKSFALHLAQKNETAEIFFVSLSAARTQVTKQY